MSPEEQTSAIDHLRHDLAAIAGHVAEEIRGTLNNGLKLMVHDHKTQLGNVKDELAAVAGQLAGHIAKEE